MNKLFSAVFSLALVIGITANAHAYFYTFFDDSDGTGTATMDIAITGNTMTIIVENTTDLSYGAPAITGFGFSINPDDLSPVSWELTAYEYDPDDESFAVITLGDSVPTATIWKLDEYAKVEGVELDFIPHTDLGVNGGLYNPDAVGSDLLGADPYFTTVTLTLVFDETPTLDLFINPYVRMQNTGLDAEGSLKIYSDPVPEPATMLLFGTGLAGLAGVARRKRR